MTPFKSILLVSITALACAACGAFDPPFETGSPAWHDRYAKRLYGTWADEPYYTERR